MGLFDKLFNTTTEIVLQPDIRFGRYSDSYKSKEQYDAWDLSLDQFEKGNFLEAYRQFFTYLRDEKEDNVKFWEENKQLRFEIIQGSKKILGFANREKVKAEAKVAKTESLNIGFMRRLMEENFKMKYSRFGLDMDNDIAIIFDTYVLDGSPYKLYYALKEVATKADKLDDLLIDEFEVLHHTDESLLQQIDPAQKEIKYQKVIQEIREVLQEIEHGKLKQEQYPGGIAYLLLNLNYKLDYLTAPEGMLMESLERIHRLYFTKDGKTNLQKNAILQKEFEKLLEYPKEDFFKGMYRVITSFGITKPVTHDRVVSFIDGELYQMNWYQENHYNKVALAIPGYIVGYCLFNYAIPKPDKDLFYLYLQIIEGKYFQQLGFNLQYVDFDTNKFNKKAIKRAIKEIVEANQKKYPKLNPDLNRLSFDGILNFAHSFLLMVRNLDLTRMD